MRSILTICTVVIILAGCTEDKKATDENLIVSETKNQEWKLSNTFDVKLEEENGNLTTRTLIGEENHIAFLPPEKPIAKKLSKYLWVFWGEPKELQNGILKVEAINKDTGEKIIVLENHQIATEGERYIGDASSPSNMSFPSAGIWKLNVYINDKIFGNIVLKVS